MAKKLSNELEEEYRKYPRANRVLQLEFLFRPRIARDLMRHQGGTTLALMIANAVLSGERGKFEFDLLFERYHPDQNERRAACQRMLDYFESSYEMEVRKAEQQGNPLLAEQYRKDALRARENMERSAGGPLLHRKTIEVKAEATQS